MQPINLPGPKAKSIIDRDKAVISGSFTRGYPFVMDHGKGTEVWDVDGNRFLDFVAGIAVVATGHSHPRVVKAIQEQAEKFIHISSDFFHEKWAELGERLNKIAPFSEDAHSFMTNSGTESVEAAIKLARHHTGRSQFVGFLGAFHGRTMGSLAFTASKPIHRHGFYPLLGGVIHAPYPNPYRPILNSRPGEDYGKTVVRYIEEELFSRILPPSDVAGIMVEAIQGEGGYVIPPEGFFPELRKLCNKYDILLIVDEVQTGIGRTGKWWAIEHFGVEPDIVCSAKGIASGMPLGAIIARKSVMTWPEGAHANTYGGNPLSCTAALVTMDLIEEGYMENASEVGQYTLDALEEIMVRHKNIGDVRGKGLMIGIEFVKDRSSKEPYPSFRNRVEAQAFKHGLIALGCGVSTLRLAPPLNITKSEVDEGLTILEYAISQTEKEM